MTVAAADMSSVRPILIANRGEIALRIQRSISLFTLSDADSPSNRPFLPLCLYTKTESNAAHVLAVPPSQRIELPTLGPRAYLDIPTIINLAKKHKVWGIAPGYGFLSESVEFAKAVEDNGMVWIGPGGEALALFGNKITAKKLAVDCQVPILQGTQGDDASLQDVLRFTKSLPSSSKVIIKAVSGGGGRGMRVVDLNQYREREVKESYETCVREAQLSFNDGRVYAERFLEEARHIEVQIVGDGTGDVAHLWERECSLQRKHQKLVEIAPSPTLTGGLTSKPRKRLLEAALRMASKGKYKSLGTFEFLYLASTEEFFFMEANPRIQVEHTVTEQVTSLDLVAIQLQIAAGASLKDLGLGQQCASLPFPTQTSIQVRINAESMQTDGSVMPTGGTLTNFHIPSGPGIRIDTSVHTPLLNGQLKYQHDPSFDSLLAKAIFTAPSYNTAIQVASFGLKQLEMVGIESNVYELRALLDMKQVRANKEIHTRFFEENLHQILQTSQEIKEKESGRGNPSSEDLRSSNDQKVKTEVPDGLQSIASPLAGILVDVLIKEGEELQAGQRVALVESMKMEHVIRANKSGKIDSVLITKGSPVSVGDHLLFFKPIEETEREEGALVKAEEEDEDVHVIRDDLNSILQRKDLLTDTHRQKALQKRKANGFLSARENVKLLIDDGTFIEYGDFALAAQRTRMDEDRLLETTSGDGVITGWATVNGQRFTGSRDGLVNGLHSSPARCALVIYDYMVLAGTQGHFHHLKLDRIFRSVLDNPAPLILYAEGGGGRPGDVDLMNVKVAGLDTPSFALLALIRSRGYPSIGLANGYTFAGNAALLGTCDIVVATRGSQRGATSTGMGGPAMIEGGGLGIYKPAEIGPVAIHEKNGDYDVVVDDEEKASIIIKRLLSYFQGPAYPPDYKYTKDVKTMRRLLPKNRVRAYDVKIVIDTVCDDGSFVELGSKWGQSLVTGFGSIQGETIGIVASSVLSSIGGAIDSASAQKATRFIKLLHRTKAAHLLVLCDTPGFMVGPKAEPEGGLRSFAEFFESIVAFQDGHDAGRIFAITLRKAYGLGAQALLGGSTLNNFFSAAWPQGEYAGMGIEGAVRLGMKKELEAVKDKEERDQLFQSFVDVMYKLGRSENMATMGEIDTVIDPADTRSWLINGLKSVHSRIPTWKRRDDRHNPHL